MTALGVMGVTTPAEWLTRGRRRGVIYSRRRFVAVTTISTLCLPQPEQTNRSRQSSTGVFGAVSSSHLGGIGLDLMLASVAPDDQPDLGGGAPAALIKPSACR
jgi:hypothetical protein